MGRSRNPKKAKARQASAAQRLEQAQSATPAAETTPIVSEITEAPSRARKNLPDHLCDDPNRCKFINTDDDCFWTTYEVIYNRSAQVTLVKAA